MDCQTLTYTFTYISRYPPFSHIVSTRSSFVFVSRSDTITLPPRALLVFIRFHDSLSNIASVLYLYTKIPFGYPAMSCILHKLGTTGDFGLSAAMPSEQVTRPSKFSMLVRLLRGVDKHCLQKEMYRLSRQTPDPNIPTTNSPNLSTLFTIRKVNDLAPFLEPSELLPRLVGIDPNSFVTRYAEELCAIVVQDPVGLE